MSYPHILAAHFAIAFAVAAPVADVVGAILERERYRTFATAALVVAAGGALLALFTASRATGFAMARAPERFELLEWHRNVGSLSVWILAGAALLRFPLHRGAFEGWRSWAFVLPAVVAAAAALYTGGTGFPIAHEAQGARSEASVPRLEPLDQPDGVPGDEQLLVGGDDPRFEA